MKFYIFLSITVAETRLLSFFCVGSRDLSHDLVIYLIGGDLESICLNSFYFRIRPLRSIRAIAEPWDKGDGFEQAKVDVARVAQPGCRSRRCHHRRHDASVALQPGRDHHCRGTAWRPPHARWTTSTRLGCRGRDRGQGIGCLEDKGESEK